MATTKRPKTRKRELVTQVIRDAREYSIGMVSFHQAVGRILGLNVTDMKCLDVMTMKGSATPSQLAEQTGLSSGATTAVIDRLEKAGLVERHPHPKDRRGTVLILTKHPGVGATGSRSEPDRAFPCTNVGFGPGRSLHMLRCSGHTHVNAR